MVAKHTGVEFGPFVAHHVDDYLLIARLAFSRHHDRVPHGGVAAKGDFDFAQLNAEAAYLQLKVNAPEKLDVAAGQVSDEVAGSI
ncbi:MAG TPA: hypothetical protein VF611_20825 [Pyrinomonadaceae bacterium]